MLQVSTSLTFDETQELLTVVLMPEKKFKELESKIVDIIGEEEHLQMMFQEI